MIIKDEHWRTLVRARSRCTFKRYNDRFYAVVIGKRRGPVGHSKQVALLRFLNSGLIADARTD